LTSLWNPQTDNSNRVIGIYVHIPFCLQKCAYCDFPSYAGLEDLFSDYTAALCREIAGRGGLLSNSQVDTVYIGGGTPTLLPTDQLLQILDSLRRNFSLCSEVEISIEANPGTVDQAKLMALRAAGFNRLSLGVQSFSDPVLRQAGRIHSAFDAIKAITVAQASGFANINVDLMYGFPDQTEADFRASIAQAVALEVTHISAYGLKVEEGTPLAAELSAGRVLLPDEDRDLAMYELAVEKLPASGYSRYEISNYAKPEAQCRHNLKYWRYQPYLGFGAAACTFADGRRSTNTKDIEEYLRCVTAGLPAIGEEETLDLATAMAEYTFLSLRTVRGLNFVDFYRQFQVNFVQYYRKQIGYLSEKGLLTLSQEEASLTETGMKFGNMAFLSFLPEKDK
jgi:oxygen-independent coproporphyrinogen III oxidase